MFEYDYFDGDHFITFDIIEVDEDNGKITLAISNQGRITQDTFDLLEDDEMDEEMTNDIRYFEFGLQKVILDNRVKYMYEIRDGFTNFIGLVNSRAIKFSQSNSDVMKIYSENLFSGFGSISRIRKKVII